MHFHKPYSIIISILTGGINLNINEKIEKLRQLMIKEGVTAYIVPTSDPHQSEYVADHYKARAWVSGFTGSAGTVVITRDEALLWTDGRYFIQAEQELEGSEFKLMKIGTPNTPGYMEWLKDNLKTGDKIAFDGKLLSQATVNKLEKTIDDPSIKLVNNYDLIDEIWENRPSLPKGKIFIHEEKYTGLTVVDKLKNVRKKMKNRGAHYFLLGSLDDIAWLYNIRGSDIAYNPVVIAYGLVTMDQAYLFVDKDKINEEVQNFLEDAGVKIKEYNEVLEYVRQIPGDSQILLDENKINNWLYKAINRGCKIINQIDITTKLKAVKSHTELENQKNAYIKDGVALVKFLHWLDKNIGKVEITELSAAAKLEEFRREQDLFIEPSFETISAYGANAAMAHYAATEDSYAKLRAEGLYLVDSGGQYLDGTTDITRTVALGPVSKEERKDFTLTLKGHINLISARFLAGTRGSQLDILCRHPLWQAGLDYKHGTGHGVGYFLNVHEGPHRIAAVSNDVPLKKGMVVSIEPGVYKAGKHGIRIENIVVVDEDIKTESGQFFKFEVLSFVPIDLACIDKSMLTKDEKQWINKYHSHVFDKISPYLNKEERAWLEKKTKAI